MKLQTKAAVITAGIITAAIVLGTIVAYFPGHVAAIAFVFIVGVFIRHIYQDILYRLQKAVDPKRDSM